MNGLPKQLFYVKILGALDENAKSVGIYKKGGGKYSNLASAITQRDHLRKYNHLDARVFVTQELEWTEVTDG